MVKDLREEISSPNNDTEQLKSSVENHEQYSKRNLFTLFQKNNGKV